MGADLQSILNSFEGWLHARAVIPTTCAVIIVTCAAITVPSAYAQSSNNARILPADPDAIGGGNPFQGLGRQDDSAQNRRSQFESSDPSTSATPPPGSVNPNIPPDLPPAPPTDPIEIQRDKEAKEKELEDQKKEEAKEKANAEKPPNSLADTPLKKAILEMHLHNYEQSLTHLDNIIATNPKNAEAHYLKAVIYVLTRKYDAAAAEYQQVLKSAPSPTLSRRAKAGLTKLSR
jgi:tetratricopeptide (TPR) repeat protein